jgi:hypothetical protein
MIIVVGARSPIGMPGMGRLDVGRCRERCDGWRDQHER